MLDAHAKGDILFSSHVGEKRVRLEYHAHRTFTCGAIGDILSVKKDTPSAGRFKASHHTQDGGFATTAWTKECKKLTLLNGYIDMIDSSVLPELFGDIL